MKRIIFLLICSTFISFIDAQIPSNCNVAPPLQKYYERDVKHLALQRIFQQQSSYMDSILIPQIYQDTIWETMAAIFNLTDLPARDSVFDLYCIHHYGSLYIYHSITVGLESTCPWLQQWKNLITTTGVPALDSLLAKYGFKVTDYLTYLDRAKLTTTQTINIYPVIDSILTFAGVAHAEPGIRVGDGDKIFYSVSGSHRYLDFVIGYGDCPSGCTGEKIFSFDVFTDCSVDYIGSYFYPASGYDFPSPVNCKITSGNKNYGNPVPIRIGPNPVEDVLMIETEFPLTGDYSVVSSTGQMVKRGRLKDRQLIHVDDLPGGLYILIIQTQEKVGYSKRFIKR